MPVKLIHVEKGTKVQAFKNLIRNRWTYFNGPWYVASGTPVHHGLYKSWPLVDDLFYRKVKFGRMLLNGTTVRIKVFRKFCSL